jgi:phosphoribosylformimino-5-aminoimidazole carboxamide ribotide isomerase
VADTGFIVFPAIDLRAGRVVRLRGGDPTAETIFDDLPADAARRWESAGAAWLHVVNLDAALGDGGSPSNLRRLAEIRRAVGARIQFGGGLRSLAAMDEALALGADRLVVGTLALSDPALLDDVLRLYGPEKIVVALDARDGKVATHGWTASSGIGASRAAAAMRGAGVQRILYTDIGRDGALGGSNVEATAALARSSGLAVIASGGVSGEDDIRALAACVADGVEGVVVGQALYSGATTLPGLLRAAGSI